MFPSLPPWEGVHVFLVHFPIALLAVAPIFVLLDLIFFRRTPMLGVSAIIILLLGTGGIFLAMASGEAAEEIVNQTPQIHEVLERHEENAEISRTVFSVLTVLYACFLLVPAMLRKAMPIWAGRSLRALFFVLAIGAGVFLATVAHDGGLLVHKLGIQAKIEK